MTDFARMKRCDTRIVRIFNTYGPRMLPTDGRVISNVLIQTTRNEPITVYGDGQQTRSFCYVDDLIRGIDLLMECTKCSCEPVNLGNPHELTINELVAAVQQIVAEPLNIVKKPLPVDDPTRRRPDITRAKELLGWTPQVDLVTGLKKTLLYFQKEEGDKAASEISTEISTSPKTL